MKNVLLLIIAMVMIGMFITSCQQDDLPNGGEPVIYYVRNTDPDKSDSLYSGANLGGLIAIIGDNLGATQQVFFNDQEAVVNIAYVTNKTILVSVPSDAPKERTDKLTLIFKDGKTLEYDFEVTIAAPELHSMKNEWAVTGETAIIYGNYFFEPLSVKFSDGTAVVPSSVTQTEIKFVVPAGAPSGALTVTTNFGLTVSTNFQFHDKRNIFLNYDNLTSTGSWRSGTVSNVGGIDGNYLLLKGVLNKNERSEDFTGGGYVSEFWASANGRSQGNLFTGNPEDYALKFEANVIDWYGSYLNICFAPWSHRDSNAEYWSNDLNARALWRPWEVADAKFKTDGWITVTIPITEFKYAQAVAAGDVVYNIKQFDKNATGSMSFWVVGTPKANASPVEIRMDNVRIVSIKN